MDTRYWGPSGWKLLHMIVHSYDNTDKNKKIFKEFFELIPFILPCKFCRHSLSEYYEDDPINLDSRLDLSKWLYRIHNKVNDKLRNQGQNIKKNPSWESVKKEYDTIVSTPCYEFPGWDFLFSIAETHPSSKLVKTSKPIGDAPSDIKTIADMNKWNTLSCEERHSFYNRFWQLLPDVFPYDEWTDFWKSGPALDLTDRKSLLKSLWKLRSDKDGKTFKGLCNTLKDQRSGCGVSSRGKTCRKKRVGK